MSGNNMFKTPDPDPGLDIVAVGYTASYRPVLNLVNSTHWCRNKCEMEFDSKPRSGSLCASLMSYWQEWDHA